MQKTRIGTVRQAMKMPNRMADMERAGSSTIMVSSTEQLDSITEMSHMEIPVSIMDNM